ncbi:MAG: 4Fe-4S binding protein [Candidatus Omnitrophica bacterium]|nr:4Fe-4S binding protein [Candidatus Omnitrophota bacterium]MDD5237015.1 4Fe-4S binding protein [Candidatus Omnitrophota bacterium]MDD5610287.1 4Fe-4S binding protein [Candidatus Omnitrophota bacterium]
MFGPLTTKPGTSKANKTGSWRVKSRPKFLQKNCIGCKMCTVVCPENCIVGKEKNAYYCEYFFCKGCGLCANICPKKDILMIEEDKEEKEKK